MLKFRRLWLFSDVFCYKYPPLGAWAQPRDWVRWCRSCGEFTDAAGCRRDSCRWESAGEAAGESLQVSMAEDGTLPAALRLLVNLSRVLLQEAEQAAGGRTDVEEACDWLGWKCWNVNVSVAKEGGNHRTSVLSELFWVLWVIRHIKILSRVNLMLFVMMYVSAVSIYLNGRRGRTINKIRVYTSIRVPKYIISTPNWSIDYINSGILLSLVL